MSGPPVYDARAGGFEYGLYRALKDVEEFAKYRECDEHMALINGPVKDGVAGKETNFLSAPSHGESELTRTFSLVSEMVSFQIQG